MYFPTLFLTTLLIASTTTALPTIIDAREASPLPLPLPDNNIIARGQSQTKPSNPRSNPPYHEKLKKCSIQGYDYMCKAGETTCRVQLIDQHGKKGAWATGICMELPGQQTK